MNLTWLLRMARWARHPPSMRRVMLGAGVIALCLGLAGIEALGLWPEWLTAEPGKRLPKF